MLLVLLVVEKFYEKLINFWTFYLFFLKDSLFFTINLYLIFIGTINFILLIV